jgi:hypothetical protein
MLNVFKPQLVMKINWLINKEFGTTYGIRYEADIDMACSKPTPLEIAIYIAKHHPFVDGNKRTAIAILKYDETPEKTLEQNHDVLELLSFV